MSTLKYLSYRRGFKLFRIKTFDRKCFIFISRGLITFVPNKNHPWPGTVNLTYRELDRIKDYSLDYYSTYLT